MMMMIALTLVHIRERRRGEGEVWKNLRGGGGECWLRGNGENQSVTCCTMCKRGLSGD